MAKLLHYEFRKSRSALLALLVCTAVGEVMLLLGTALLPQGIFLLRGEPDLGGMPAFLLLVGSGFLSLCGTFGVMLCSLMPVWALRRELNSDQGLMLFLVPENSFAVLGSKVLQNVLILAGSVLAYGLLALLDVSLLAVRGIGPDALSEVIQFDPAGSSTWGGFLPSLGMVALSWLTILMICLFSIVLQASFFRGKRGAFWISLLIDLFLILLILRADSLSSGGTGIFSALINCGAIVLLYLASGWMMERHVSL